MPLSEQEQRLLDEMERSLYHNEADDVTTMGGRRGRASYTALLLGVLGVVVGIVLLIVGVSVRQPWVGVLGFVVMLGGVVFAIAPPRRLTIPRGPASAKRTGLMDSLNERWERRQDDGDN
jgi:uncharacterized membrane protein YkgB